MKKRLLSLILIGTMMLTMVACGNSKDVSQNPSETEQGTETSEVVSTETESVEDTTTTETTQQEETQEPVDAETTPSESEEPSESESESKEPSKPEEPEESEESEDELDYVYKQMDKTMYAKSNVNVRKGPDSLFDKIGSLRKEQEVHVTGQCVETGWYQIDYNGGVAYVSDSYLTETKPEDPKPEEPSEPEHTCNYSTLKYDSNGHWYVCSCGAKSSTSNHDYTDDKDTTCNTCGYTRTITPDEPQYDGYDEFGNGYVLDKWGNKVFDCNCPYQMFTKVYRGNYAGWYEPNDYYHTDPAIEEKTRAIMLELAEEGYTGSKTAECIGIYKDVTLAFVRFFIP